ncbi:TPA: hypothetical protein ROX88_001026 [Bacillus pseudomycoides]|nr:hypothetical protein [Bacillus pseudomycoides]
MVKINEELFQNLKNMEVQLEVPYPFEELEQIEYSYKKDCFVEDFYEYCSLISGSLSYALSFKKIPSYQRQLLFNDFFQMYPEYNFLREKSERYLELHYQLKIHEKTQKLLIKVIENY